MHEEQYPVERNRERRERFIHSFILNICIAPLQENYSKALSTPARLKRAVRDCNGNCKYDDLYSIIISKPLLGCFTGRFTVSAISNAQDY